MLLNIIIHLDGLRPLRNSLAIVIVSLVPRPYMYVDIHRFSILHTERIEETENNIIRKAITRDPASSG